MPFDEEVVTSMMVISGPEVQTRKWYPIFSIETRMGRLMQEVTFEKIGMDWKTCISQ